MVPDLVKDDPVFVSSPYRVNDTGTMVAAGQTRVYVYVNITYGGGFQAFRMDQATGVGILAHVLAWNGTNHLRIRWSLDSTSLWSLPQEPFPAILLLAVGGGIAAVAIVAAVVLLRKRGK